MNLLQTSRYLLLGLCAVVLLTGCEEGHAAPGSKKAASGRDSDAKSQPRVVQEKPEAAFEFRYRSKLTIQGQEMAASLSGTLLRSRSWKATERVWNTYRVVNARAEIRNGKEKKTRVEGIGEPFSVGRVAAENDVLVAHLPDISTGAIQLLAGLSGAIQVTPPQGEGEKEWTAQERDVSGAFEAKYVFAEDGWIRKEKLKYLGVGTLDIDKSVSRLRLDESGALLEVNQVEELSEPLMGIRFEGSLTLFPASPDSYKGDLGIPRDALGSIPSSWTTKPIGVVSELKMGETEKAASEKPFSEAMQELRERDSGVLPVEDLMAVRTRLERNPKEIAEVLAVIKKEPQHAGPLASLLVTPQTREAQEAVLEVLSEKAYGEEVRLHVLNAVLFGGGTSEALLHRVQELRKDDSSRISIGAIDVEGELLHRARARGIFQTSAHETDYLERASQCTDIAICSAYIRGLGYLGSKGAIEIVAGHLKGPKNRLRTEAAFALEKAQDPRVDDWLAQALEVETHDTAAIRLTRACGYRGSKQCFDVLREQLTPSKPLNTRRLALRGLAGGRYPHQQVRLLVTHVSRTDPEKTVREYAEKVLQQLPAAPPLPSTQGAPIERKK